jgi:hypothetical protein
MRTTTWNFLITRNNFLFIGSRKNGKVKKTFFLEKHIPMDKHRPVFQAKYATVDTVVSPPMFTRIDPRSECHMLVSQPKTGLAMVNEIRFNARITPELAAVKEQLRPHYGDIVDPTTAGGKGTIVLKNLGPFSNCIYLPGSEVMMSDDSGLYRPNRIDGGTVDSGTAVEDVVFFPHFEGMCFVRLWRHAGKNMFSTNNKIDARYSKAGGSTVKTYTELCAAFGMPTHTELFGTESDSGGMAHVFCLYHPSLQVGKMKDPEVHYPFLGRGKLFYFGTVLPGGGKFVNGKDFLASGGGNWLRDNVVTTSTLEQSPPEDPEEYPNYGPNITTTADLIIDGEVRPACRAKIAVFPMISREAAKKTFLLPDETGSKITMFLQRHPSSPPFLDTLLQSTTAVLQFEPATGCFTRIVSVPKAYQEFVLGTDQFNTVKRVSYLLSQASDFLADALKRPLQAKEDGGCLGKWENVDIFSTYFLQNLEVIAGLGLCTNNSFLNMFPPFPGLVSSSAGAAEGVLPLYHYALWVYTQCLASPQPLVEKVTAEYTLVADKFAALFAHRQTSFVAKLPTDPTTAATQKRDVVVLRRYNSLFNSCVDVSRPRTPEKIKRLVYNSNYEVVRSCAVYFN